MSELSNTQISKVHFPKKRKKYNKDFIMKKKKTFSSKPFFQTIKFLIPKPTKNVVVYIQGSLHM